MHEASRQTHVYLRVHAELRAQVECAGKHRVARLMAQMGLVTKGQRRFKATPQPNEKWLSDITNIATQMGWLNLARIQDSFSPRTGGLSMSERPTKALVCDSWKLAVGQRGTPR